MQPAFDEIKQFHKLKDNNDTFVFLASYLPLCNIKISPRKLQTVIGILENYEKDYDEGWIDNLVSELQTELAAAENAIKGG